VNALFIFSRSVVQQKEPYFKRLLRSRVVIVAEIVLLAILGTALAKEIVRKYQVEGEIKKLEERTAELKQQNLELSELVEYFGEDSYKEEQARLKLGLQKPGESVVAVLGAETQGGEDEAIAVQTATLAGTADETNPQRWWYYFFKTERES